MTEQQKEQLPLGKVVRVNNDGTAVIELNLDNPLACKLLAASIVGGTTLANAVLKEAQARDSN